MSLELIAHDNPILHRKAKHFNPRIPEFDLRGTIIQMFILMKEQGGIGLAAPQVGLNKRMFIMLVEGEEFVCINPTILKASKDTETVIEGCLSYPGKNVAVERSKSVKVRFLTPKGLSRQMTLRGIKARCFQHELDHLNGITIPDRGEIIDGDTQSL